MTDGPETVRLGIDVVAGLLPGTPDEEFTRRWFITSTEWWADDAKQSELLAEVNGKAQGYAMLLMLQPDRLNWVQTSWVWF
jgi:hypothetical protein